MVFIILCVEMGRKLEALLLGVQVRWLSKGNALIIIKLWAELVVLFFFFFMEWYFYLKKGLTGKLWLLRHGYRTDILSKMDKMRSTQGKQLTVFVAKCWAEDKNYNFKHLLFTLVHWIVFQYSKSFLIRSVITNENDFLNISMNMC